MHLLIPYAGLPAPAGEAAPAVPALPHLRELLPWLAESARDAGEADTLSPPHERALAAALGLRGDDGRIPWAAHFAALDGLDPGERAVGLLTPTHWQVGADRIVLADPRQMQLDEAASRAAFEAVRPLFESEGLVLQWGAPLRWYLFDDALAQLATASPDRAVNRSLDEWLPPRGQARLLRRLQNEVQMHLYTHPPEPAAAWPVNSFWISGCGVRQVATGAPPQVDERLRDAALGGDAAAWAQAWSALDAGPVADMLERVQRGEPATLTLCGERTALTLRPRPRHFADRLLRRWQAGDVAAVLESL